MATVSLSEVDRQQAVSPSEGLADAGHTAVDAAYRFAIARAGAQSARCAEALSAEQVLLGALEGLAHLCDRLDLDPCSLFASALQRRRDTLLASEPAQAKFDLGLGAQIVTWSALSAPSTTHDAHADTVLTLLHDRAEGITSTELRDLGVRNPSNVVMNLIRAGHPIKRIQITRGGAKGRLALYRLDRAKA